MLRDLTRSIVRRLAPRGSRRRDVLGVTRRFFRRPVDQLSSSPALAHLWRMLMFRTTVIAVTGSVGKSTCKELLAEILASQARTHKTLNNENDIHGVPRVLLRMRPWHRFAVIELGASGPGTLSRLARLVRPDIAIITAVARTHTNRYSSIDDIAVEKSQLLRYLKPGGIAILNGDDERVSAMQHEAGHSVQRVGTSAGCDFIVSEIRHGWPERLSLTIARRGHVEERRRLRTQLVGSHWVPSVLAAVAAAHACGVSMSRAVEVIERVPPFRGRMQPVRLANGAVMVRDENASVDVLDAMLRVAGSAVAGRRIVVLGDIVDSGITKSKKRRILAGSTVAAVADVAVFVGQSSRYAAHAAASAGLQASNVFAVESIAQAHALLQNLIEPGDLVFVKGMSSQHLSRLVLSQLGEIGCWKDHCKIRKDCDICPNLRPRYDLDQALRWKGAS
jgi:UDP-N-acetylmuramoyl-tripeptide--D-alanyl-D-alanine ligase